MKPGRILLFLFLIAVVIIIYINKIRPAGSSNQQNKLPAGNAAPAMNVSGYVLQPASVTERIFSTGTLLSNEEVEIRNEVPGKITGIFFKEGAKVAAGDVLIKIYDVDIKAQLDKLILEKELAEKNEARQKDLLDIKGVSQQDYDEALNRLNTLKADVELTQSQLAKTEIRSPFSGILGLKTVSTGAYIPVNTRIVTVQSIDPVKVEFSVPERYRSSVKPSGQVYFTVESSPEKFSASIYAFEPKVNPDTRTITIRALCPNHAQLLLPGSFAHIEMPLEKNDSALMVPTQAVMAELKGQRVYVTRGGKVVPVKVMIGLRNDTAVQVTEGLERGDTVLTTGMMQLRPGMSVNVSLN